MKQNLGFISDLHLSAEQSEITALFEEYIKTSAKQLSELYILGDLFDYWIGGDYDQEYNQHILELLKELTKSTKVFFMHGNRDFLIQKAELAEYHITLLNDPSIITVAEKKILLTHGDQFCTLDRNYQLMRRVFQHHYTKKLFLRLPLQLRKLTANTTRNISNNENKKKNLAKLSTAPNSVLECARKHNIDMIIHGHTHSKQVDTYQLKDKTVTRIIMPSWEPKNCYELTLSTSGDHQFVSIDFI